MTPGTHSGMGTVESARVIIDGIVAQAVYCQKSTPSLCFPSCVFCRAKLLYPQSVQIEHRERAALLFAEQVREPDP